MFKKNTFIKMELLSNGEFLITSHIDKNTNSVEMGNFINKLLYGENLSYLLDSIIKSGEKNVAKDKSNEICDIVTSLRDSIEIKPKSYDRRQPLVDPCELMQKLSGSEDE